MQIKMLFSEYSMFHVNTAQTATQGPRLSEGPEAHNYHTST